MKEPYELRVIADALERWTEGPAVNAMKYAMTTLREIADEIDNANAALRSAQPIEQEPIPSSPLPSTTAASPVADVGVVVEQSEATNTASSTASSPASSENPTPAAEASPVTSTLAPAASSPAPASESPELSTNPPA